MIKKSNSGIWITGASSGIGKAAAIEFARTGSKVFVSSRRVNELNRINKELEDEKIAVDVFPCNIASHTNVEQVIKKILPLSNIDCIVNNAGITSFKNFENNSVQEINDIIHTNLLGAIYTSKYILPHFIKNGGGTIINVLSTAAIKVFTGSAVYTASKLGLLGFMDVMREEVRQYNVRIINIIPGPTDTPMWSADMRKENSEKMMTTDEVARVIVWAFLQRGNIVTENITLRPIQGDL